MKPAMRPLRLVLSAGEASGDQIAADLALALKRREPSIELAGLAGPAMRAAGVEAWLDIDQLSVMGLSEVLAHLPRLVRLRRAFRRRILAWPADAFIGVDAPDFNLGLARQLKRRGTLAIHYVSPSVWAWRAGRIPRIARSLDLLLTLYPFEPGLYRPHGLDSRFVGHHLADALAGSEDRAAARTRLGLDPEATVIALLPGSRGGELDRHAQLLADTATLLRRQLPEASLLLPLAAPAHQDRLWLKVGTALETAAVQPLIDQTRPALAAADLALAASGTVTLEAFLLGCPLVVFYRVAPASYALARSLNLVKSAHVSLPNILSQQALVPERIQHLARPDQLLADALAWLDDPARVARYRAESQRLAATLAIGAGERAAAAILERLGRA